MLNKDSGAVASHRPLAPREGGGARGERPRDAGAPRPPPLEPRGGGGAARPPPLEPLVEARGGGGAARPPLPPPPLEALEVLGLEGLRPAEPPTTRRKPAPCFLHPTDPYE